MEENFEITITLTAKNLDEATLEQYLKSLIESGPASITIEEIYAELSQS